MKKSCFLNEVSCGVSFISCSALTLLSIFLSWNIDVPFLPVLSSWLLVVSFILLVCYLVSLVANTKNMKRGLWK